MLLNSSCSDYQVDGEEDEEIVASDSLLSFDDE